MFSLLPRFVQRVELPHLPAVNKPHDEIDDEIGDRADEQPPVLPAVVDGFFVNGNFRPGFRRQGDAALGGGGVDGQKHGAFLV